jgi:hypothetical protein
MADVPVHIAGLRGTEDFGTDERPKNFRETILWLDPNGMTPITGLSSKFVTESTDDPEFAWWEEVQDAKRAKYASGTTTIVVEDPGATGNEAAGVRTDDPAYQFKANDLLMVRDDSAGQPDDYVTTTEIIRVTSVTDQETLVVDRDFNDGSGIGSSGITLTTSDTLLYVGSAWEEGSASPDPYGANPVKNLNYTQIFKTSFELTNTARATRFRTGDPFANSRKRAMFKHAEGLEQSIMWGYKHEETVTKPLRMSGGLRYFFTTNSDGNVGAIDDNFFLDTLSTLFDFNAGGAGDQRICYVGNGALNAIQKVVRDASGVQVQYNGKIKFYGLNLLEYQIPQGTFYLKSHPLLNTDPVFRNSMFVTNPRGMKRRPLRGRDTKIQTEIQNNDLDTRKDQWVTETGWEIGYQRTQGYYGNIL